MLCYHNNQPSVGKSKKINSFNSHFLFIIIYPVHRKCESGNYSSCVLRAHSHILWCLEQQHPDIYNLKKKMQKCESSKFLNKQKKNYWLSKVVVEFICCGLTDWINVSSTTSSLTCCLLYVSLCKHTFYELCYHNNQPSLLFNKKCKT